MFEIKEIKTEVITEAQYNEEVATVQPTSLLSKAKKVLRKKLSRKHKAEDLKNRLKECVTTEDRTMERDHINPDEYMEFLAQYKTKYFNGESYSSKMDDIDESMAEVKHDEVVSRLRDIINK